MVQAIREVESSLGTADARRISQGEMMNREVLAKSIVARHSIQAGEVITAEHLMIRSPGKGLAAYRKQDLIGRVIKRTVSEGDFFYASDIEVDAVKARNYQFSRPFGVPVRYHDVAAMIACSKIDLLEFHFSYQDMSLNAADFLDASGYDLDFIVHAPELFANDHLLDLCADDALYRQQSIAHLQEVIHVTRSLKKFFRTVRPLIIVNVGGFSLDGFMPKAQRQSKYHLIADALSLLDTDGVEIIPQTMPPFPWHFGGQRYHNLFMDAQDIVNFCVQTGSRVCLDISHSKLACAHTHSSFSQFLEDVAPHAAHLHLVDALGVDGEGLQIGDGDIDFVMTAQKLSRHCPTASFIPEVWQGHKNNGEGFWIALEKLEAFNF
jgi:N-acetylneuraminate synthase